MSLQTIFLTNRRLRKNTSARNKKKSIFGEKIIASHDPIHMAIAEQYDHTVLKRKRRKPRGSYKVKEITQTYKLSLVEKGSESAVLQNISEQADNGRPWVLFLHGNNQSLDKNLEKSRRIQEEYQVNLIIFSWPSFSYDPKTIPGLAVGGVLALLPITRLVSAWVLKKTVKNRIKQYKEARKMAAKTVTHFTLALELVCKELLNPLMDKENPPHTCLLVHSLGHRVLRLAVENDPTLLPAFTFNKALFHQADEREDIHPDWMHQMPLVNDNEINVTRNVRDSVLFLSGLVNNNFNPLQALSRIGNRGDHDSEHPELNYHEFTGLNGVGFGHDIAWDEDVSAQIKTMCSNILTQD